MFRSRLATPVAGRAHGRRTTFPVVRALVGALALAATPVAAARAQSLVVDAPVRNTPVFNRATVSFRMQNGLADSAIADNIMEVARQAGLAITGPFAAPAAPTERRVFSHLLTNRGSDADMVQLSVAAPSGWTAALYLDTDDDGQLGAADQLISAGVTIAPSASVHLLAVVDVPAAAPDGSVAAILLRAASTADARVVVGTTDQVTVSVRVALQPSMTFSKTVDRTTATVGDTLRFTIAYRNVGAGDAAQPVIVDTLPSGLSYVAASLRLDGQLLTDAADADAATIARLADGRTVATVTPGAIAPNAGGALTFFTTIALDAPAGPLANIAVISYGDSARQFSLNAASTAITTVATSALTISESIVGPSRVTVGSSLQFRLAYANASTTAARNAVLADTLPAELSLVSAAGAVVTGQVVSWNLGTLDPGAAGTRDLFVKVIALPSAGTVADHSTITADNAIARDARALASVAAFGPRDLKVTKSASALEAGLGDAVPYAVSVRNTSGVTLRGLVVRDLLPAEMKYAATGLAGADSAVATGNTVDFYVSAPLAAGATATVRYAAVVVAPPIDASLVNRATALAEDGLVQGDTAMAPVAVRRTLAMRERTLVGKVWLDRNADGVQQAGEEGVAGVQVWDATGEVLTTDKEGRFSLRNMSLGTHALRLDPLGIPKDFVFASPEDEVVMVRADGWTMPRTSIRLVPRAGAVPALPCSCAPAARASAVSLTSAPSANVAAVAPLAAPLAVAAPTIAPVMTSAQRADMYRQELVTGPRAHVVAPVDGAVLAGSRFYAGVKGAPGAHVRLYDGAALLREGQLRADGRQDFVNVPLAAGRHMLRITTVVDSAAAAWDSVVVHVSGAPASFELPAQAPVLRGDAAQAVPVRVRVLDQWGVPVANAPIVTVAAKRASVDAPDADAGSVGMQLRADAAGWLSIPLRAGHEVGAGELRLTAGRSVATLPIGVSASVRPLLATGVGQIGVGASPDAFGAMTVQGAIGEQTSVSVSYDSRRTPSGDAAFQRTFDPLGDDNLPAVGDNSSSRFVAPSSRSLAARVDHGMDWIAAGDVRTTGFGRDGDLGAYRRSITGVSGQIGTGAATWNGFGTMTRQAIERRQLRGEGSSGPYLVGGDIRPGTEILAIEVRSRDNAARVVTRQELVRITDYQIDYVTGAVLLRLPVPSTDPYGNPVFVVATAERLSGGASHFVGGLRLDLDAARAMGLGLGASDTLVLGLSGIRDAGVVTSVVDAPATHLFNADVRFHRGVLSLGASALRVQSPDSSGSAASATARLALPGDRLAVDARWMTVDAGLGAADPRLAAAVNELSVGIQAALPNDGSVRLHHDVSRFTQFEVERSVTGLVATETVAGRRITEALGLQRESTGGLLPSASTLLTARLTTAMSANVDTWIDASRSLAASSDAVARPDQMGAGMSMRLPAGLRLEASRRQTRTAGDSTSYGVTSAQLRADRVLGGSLWTGFEESSAGLNDEVRNAHAALLGWNQSLALGAGWQLTSMYEKRFGLSRARLADPDRALPFAEAESDRWTAAMGLAWTPGGDQMRFTMNGEVRNAATGSARRVQIAGDAALNAGLAILTLHDWSTRHDALNLGASGDSRQDRSLLGVALRPVTTDRVNVLGKLEWRRSSNPLGASLLTSTTSDMRLIGSADAVWAPALGTELGARYAVRFAAAEVTGDAAQRVTIANHFAGLRAERAVLGALRLRADGRLLVETGTGSALWNLAPSAVYDLQGRITLEGGYRFGALRDPDFANVGGAGAFATIGFRFTENDLGNPAAFWRERVAADR